MTTAYWLGLIDVLIGVWAYIRIFGAGDAVHDLRFLAFAIIVLGVGFCARFAFMDVIGKRRG